MKKLILLCASTLFAFSANAEVVLINAPLTDKNIYDIVYKSAENYLEFDGGDVNGGLIGDLQNPIVVSETQVAGLQKMEVTYGVSFISFDSEFGDPVHEESFQCTSRLSSIIGGAYTVENTATTCDIDPKVDFKDEIYEEYKEFSNPCCTDSGPIVDSNMCFDSFEEGEAFCNDL